MTVALYVGVKKIQKVISADQMSCVTFTKANGITAGFAGEKFIQMNQPDNHCN